MAKIKNKKQFSLMIAMLMLAVGLFVATKSVQNNQENRSQAASTSSDNLCKSKGGTCVTTGPKTPSGSSCTTNGKAGTLWRGGIPYPCSGSNTRVCCIPKKITASIKGECKKTYSKTNACVSGTQSDRPNDLYLKSDGTKTDKIQTNIRIEYRWSCGTNNKCVQKIKINGVCDTSKVNGCKSGISSTNPTDTATKVLWTCKGINNGTDSPICNKSKSTVSTTKKIANPVSKVIPETDASNNDWKTFYLSFYTSLPNENGGYTHMANGAPINTARDVVASNVYKLGTKIYLEGYGIKTVADRGGSNFNNSNRLDVLIPRKSGENDHNYYVRVNNMGRPAARGYIVKTGNL